MIAAQMSYSIGTNTRQVQTEIEAYDSCFEQEELDAIVLVANYLAEDAELPPQDENQQDALASMLEELEILERWASQSYIQNLRFRIEEKFNEFDMEREWQEEHAREEYMLNGPSIRRQPVKLDDLRPTSPPGVRAGLAERDLMQMFSSLLAPE